MQVILPLVTFYSNCGLHAVSIGKSSERMLNFGTIRFFKNRIRTEFQFSAHPWFSPYSPHDQV